MRVRNLSRLRMVSTGRRTLVNSLGRLTLMLWNARRLPCPVDPVAARSCARLRRQSEALYGLAVVAFVVGGLFAFVLPLLSE
jgi:hypothetical protein